jgi:hypothetical protein
MSVDCYIELEVSREVVGIAYPGPYLSFHLRRK